MYAGFHLLKAYKGSTVYASFTDTMNLDKYDATINIKENY